MTQKEKSRVNNESLENEVDLLQQHDSNKLTKKQRYISWRRQAIFNLLVRGITSTYQIAETMKISQSTAARDVQFMKSKCIDELKFHIQQRLPWEYKLCSEGISQVLKHAWDLVLEGDIIRSNKVGVLSLISQLYKDRLELATNASIITSALQEVERIKNQMLELELSKHESNSRLSTTSTASITPIG